MALNFPGPWQVRIEYVVAGREHVQKLNCIINPGNEGNVGDPFSAFIPTERDGSETLTLDLQVDAWAALMAPLFNSTDGEIVRAELWKIAPDSFDGSYYSAYAINVAGTSVNPTQDAAQSIITMRTQEGGIARFDFLDTVIDQGPSLTFTASPQEIRDIILYLDSGDNLWVARDTSYPVAFIRFHPGQNERWFKKIYRGV